MKTIHSNDEQSMENILFCLAASLRSRTVMVLWAAVWQVDRKNMLNRIK